MHELNPNWTNNKELADSYIELIYTTFLPTAMKDGDEKSVIYYENKIKEYEEKYGIYSSPLMRLNNLNGEFEMEIITLKEYLERMEILIMRLKLTAEVLEGGK